MKHQFPYTPPELGKERHEENLGYRIRLANGQEWNLVSTEEVNAWLQSFAEIMQLKTHVLNGSPKLIYCLKDETESNVCPIASLDPALQETLPASGWEEMFDFKHVRLWKHRQVRDVICELTEENKDSLSVIKMYTSLAPLYNGIMEKKGFPFHCGFVAKDKEAFLLAAPGNTGKSTCCRRIPPPWEAPSDDEALIVPHEGRYFVHPMPTWSNFMWNHKEGLRFSWDTNCFLPLKAIFFLEQSPEDSVEAIGQGQAAVFMNESAVQVCRRNWRKTDPEAEKVLKRKVFENACAIATKVPAYLLKVSLTGRFWEKMEEALSIKDIRISVNQ